MTMPLTALGLMSGTSMDGIDAAIIRTDGVQVTGFGPDASFAYDDGFRARLRGVLGRAPDADDHSVLAGELTRLHILAVKRLLDANNLTSADVDIIGFHGHTVFHNPQKGQTLQLGDGAMLAAETGIPVVSDFRQADVAAGGEGAPFAPLYHGALCRNIEKPVAVLNIGGVANVTWVGDEDEKAGSIIDGSALMAFDTGPGNALIDDWTRITIGRTMDEGGRLARAGQGNQDILEALTSHPYFDRPPPKSLDRDEFSAGLMARIEGLSAADGAATLTAFTVAAVARASDFFPTPVRRWLVCGGGRHNSTLIAALGNRLGVPVEPVEKVGWNGDALEAQAFAYLAVRSIENLPLSVPGTTGVAQPTTGGTLHNPPGHTPPGITWPPGQRPRG